MKLNFSLGFDEINTNDIPFKFWVNHAGPDSDKHVILVFDIKRVSDFILNCCKRKAIPFYIFLKIRYFYSDVLKIISFKFSKGRYEFTLIENETNQKRIQGGGFFQICTYLP
jgi:hypothetical protein